MILFGKFNLRKSKGVIHIVMILCVGLKLPMSAQDNLLLAPQTGLIQSHLVFNPAFVPSKRFTISIPPALLPYPAPCFGFSMSSSGFRLADVIKPGADNRTMIDTRSIAEQARPMNTFAASFRVDLLSAGYRIDENHFMSLEISNRAELNWEYSQDMVKLLIQGNGAEGLLGQEISPTFYLDGIHYTSVGIGYAIRPKGGRLNAGIRLRYLSGQEHIQTSKSRLELYTDANDFSLKGSADFQVRTSGLENGIFQGENKLVSGTYLFGQGNNGAALDAGIMYSINESWQIAASVNDLGFIRWKNDVKTFSSKEPGAVVEFEGIDLTDYQEGNITVQEAFDELTDSLSARFELKEDNQDYTSVLNLTTTASLTYSFTKNQSASFVIQNTSYGQRIHPDISLAYSFASGSWFKSSLSWSYIDRTAGNLGLFLSAQKGPFQLFLCSENLLGLIFFDRYSGIPVPAYTHHASIRTGLNLAFGKSLSDD